MLMKSWDDTLFSGLSNYPPQQKLSSSLSIPPPGAWLGSLSLSILLVGVSEQKEEGKNFSAGPPHTHTHTAIGAEVQRSESDRTEKKKDDDDDQHKKVTKRHNECSFLTLQSMVVVRTVDTCSCASMYLVDQRWSKVRVCVSTLYKDIPRVYVLLSSRKCQTERPFFKTPLPPPSPHPAI